MTPKTVGAWLGTLGALLSVVVYSIDLYGKVAALSEERDVCVQLVVPVARELAASRTYEALPQTHQRQSMAAMGDLTMERAEAPVAAGPAEAEAVMVPPRYDWLEEIPAAIRGEYLKP